MIYFDTDVWIHSLVIQDEDKHKYANDLIASHAQKGYIISILNLQEILFVLGKLKIDPEKIKTIAEELFQLNTISYSLNEMQRAYEIARQMSCKQINDCIHTAIAENHCQELITFNKKDFSKIEKLTALTITLL